jgi:hypothetical protein
MPESFVGNMQNTESLAYLSESNTIGHSLGKKATAIALAEKRSNAVPADRRGSRCRR